MATSWCLWSALLICGVRGQSWPWKASEFLYDCHNVSRVCDPDKMLAEDQLEQLIQQLQGDERGEYNCQDEISIGVALALQTFHENRDYSLDAFAEEVRLKWRLSLCDNDLVLFLSNDSTKIGLSLGNSSRKVFGDSFDPLAKELQKEFEERPNNYFEFALVAARRLLALFKQRLKESDHWSLAWNALLTTGYLLVILAVVSIACYYCCYSREKKAAPDATSVLSSEMTTKYSELRPTIEMSERSSIQ